MLFEPYHATEPTSDNVVPLLSDRIVRYLSDILHTDISCILFQVPFDKDRHPSTVIPVLSESQDTYPTPKSSN